MRVVELAGRCSLWIVDQHWILFFTIYIGIPVGDLGQVPFDNVYPAE